MKKLILVLLFVSFTIIGKTQTYIVLKATAYQWEDNKWKAVQENAHPIGMFIERRENKLIIANEGSSVYSIHGDSVYQKTDNCETIRWQAYDKYGTDCYFVSSHCTIGDTFTFIFENYLFEYSIRKE
jgi:hypothetical protein